MEGVWAAEADCRIAIFSPIALTLGRRQEDRCPIDEALEMIFIAFSDEPDVANSQRGPNLGSAGTNFHPSSSPGTAGQDLRHYRNFHKPQTTSSWHRLKLQ